ncbi:HEAT repeat protein [Gemmata obscuriglobus]|nr:HEAT repeat protein [Gemmata obscuriglobus]VTS11465.1 hypothetical protein : [Gemmata obscuriglobus UQM 2246]
MTDVLPALLPLLLLLSEVLQERPAPITAGLVAEKLTALAESRPFDVRKAAAAWFVKHANEPSVANALKPLEDVAAFDQSPEVRGYAVYALGRIARANKVACPQVVFDALFDREPDPEYPEVRHVPYYAIAALHEFKPPPPALLPTIARLLRSPDPHCRMDGVVLVNNFTGDTASRKVLDQQPAVARLILKATTDPELEVRRVAAYTQFQLTKDVAEFFGNALRHQDDVASLPALPMTATEPEKSKRTGYRIGAIGVTTMMEDRVQESATVTRDAFLKLLAGTDARTRRLTAGHLGRIAAPADEAPPHAALRGAAFDVKRLQANTKAIVGDTAIRSRLKSLAKTDPDENVRNAAKAALELIGMTTDK